MGLLLKFDEISMFAIFSFNHIDYFTYIVPERWDTCILQIMQFLQIDFLQRSVLSLLIWKWRDKIYWTHLVLCIPFPSERVFEIFAVAGVGLNFDPIEFLPVGSWFNGLCSGFNGFFMLNCDPPETGVIVLRPLRRIKFGPPLNCDPHVLIPRWMLTPSHDSTFDYDPGLGSQFNVELWHGVMIQRGILTRGHNSTLTCDPGS